MKKDLDVLVIGGGPSGSTLANLVARAGARVMVLEKDPFPRFHIGESLLPMDLEVFDRCGIDLTGHDRHLLKRGAEFYEEEKRRHVNYPFALSLVGTRDHAYQVERATFDEQLLRGAASAGAEVREGERVVEVTFSDHAAVVKSERELYEARYVVDATGLDSFLARRNKTRVKIDDFGLAAVFRHFGDVAPRIADELAVTGNIKVLFVEDGWLWAIPLGSGRLSVGLVSRKKGIQGEWLDAEIAKSPELTRILEGAHAEGNHRTIASFSFYNSQPNGRRWCCVGDAACFLDPVFSSGVSFGMMGAMHAADELVPALREGREGELALMDAHGQHMSGGYTLFASMVYDLYQRRLLPDLFFTETPDSAVRRGVTSVLAGDVWRDDNPFQQMLGRSKKRLFEIPFSPATS
jgi:flavin-dependent dehydrogenase